MILGKGSVKRMQSGGGSGGDSMGTLSGGRKSQAQMDKDQVRQEELNRIRQEGSDRVAQWDRDHPEGAR